MLTLTAGLGTGEGPAGWRAGTPAENRTNGGDPAELGWGGPGRAGGTSLEGGMRSRSGVQGD